MTIPNGETPVPGQVDAALDEVQCERERVMVFPHGEWRCARLAELAEREADWWAVLFEHARLRPQWRAALAAREAARQCARVWRRRAERCRRLDDVERPLAWGRAA